MKSIKPILSLLFISLFSFSCVCEGEPEAPSYGPPEEYDWDERYEETPTSDSQLHLYLPENTSATPTPLILILPGGCYHNYETDYEGTNWVPFILKLGYAAAILEYDLPWGNPNLPIDHINKVINYLKGTPDFHIDAEHIGIMGFSAGGHLASLISTQTIKENRPAFQILFYPVISMEDKYTQTNAHKECREYLLGPSLSNSLKEKYSSNRNVDSDTPPAFIAVGNRDNTISIDNSYSYVNALNKQNIENTLIVAPNGGHGYITWANLTPIRKTLREWLIERLPPINAPIKTE